ncbi:MAG: DUF4124 domain-containing protein [Thiogranum sp.]|nr:DUF4124 domain-containing protein [Thiogranum sp.]
MRFSPVLSIILALAVLPVSAEVYKWKSETGEIQYGQFPPAGVETERMSSSGVRAPAPQPQPEDPGAASEADAGAESPAGSAAPVQTEAEKAAAEQAAAAQQEQRRQICASARNNLGILQQGGHRRVRLPDGTVTYLTAEQTEERIAAAKQQIEATCDQE